eukprot:gnl/TRDRNA2_/TRDRNA2_163664_c0_seq1.p1 gnl/TRDRNA2_/TRDRNA2_163664_c0~~gnl/TRDRNA2_/TRDRNA2_163664_c0_seq1.p1  ORF type:complete len:380 (-),score=43.67 gnl/TRDRNA2_/TRDRNA2_163664_c0_seq1:248-1357(-)
MERIPASSSALIIASSDDRAVAARQFLEERGISVAKRCTAKVLAIVCVPCESALSGPQLQQLSRCRPKVETVLNFSELGARQTSQSSAARRVRSTGQESRGIRQESHSTASGQSAPAEKRRAMWRRSCSSATLDRIDRALEQRMFLVDQTEVEDAHDHHPARQYAVLGSTGNVYKVEVGSLVSCNCPDALKGNICKHQLFVFLRVLRTPRSSELIYQRSLLSSERQQLFASAKRPVRSAVARASVKEAYAEATGRSPKKRRKEEAENEPSHRGDANDDCTICFEALGNEKLTVCGACRNAVHETCFRQWRQAKGRDITCPFCREPWASLVVKGKSTPDFVGAEGYLNLGHEAGLPSERDDSTYYVSPWD